MQFLDLSGVKILKSWIERKIQDVLTVISAKYTKPANGIPKNDLSNEVKNSIDLSDTSVQYVTQTLTEAQKANARNNIGAPSQADLAALGNGSFIVAWDGTSLPVVSDIPYGITVIYGGEPYVGTLIADSSSSGKIFLVFDGVDEYDRYITSIDAGNVYSWVNIGKSSVTFDIVNNLIDGGTNKALSAEMGKILRSLIDDKYVFLSESEYEALVIKDPNKIYCTYED